MIFILIVIQTYAPSYIQNFQEKAYKINKSIWNKTSDLFMSYSSDDASTYKCMQFYHKNFNYIMDPHTAVAADAVKRFKEKLQGNTIILSTFAHPAKFPLALENAGILIKIYQKIDRSSK